MTTSAIASAVARQLEFLSVLRFRDFRIFWMGLLAQVSAQQMLNLTIGWLAFDLTKSPLALGYVQVAMAGPRILLSQFGGVLADRVDQRIVITVVQSLTSLLVGLLAFLTLTDRIEMWHLIVIPLGAGMVLAFDNPSRQALFPHLLPDRSRIVDAVPVIATTWQLSRIASPAVAGYVIAFAGAGNSFVISAAGFAIMAGVMRILRVNRVTRPAHGSVIHDLAEGARYAWGNPTFRVLMGMTYLSSLFGMGYLLMMPIFASAVFGVGAEKLGLMLSAGGMGAVVGTLAGPRLIKQVPVGKLLTAELFAFGSLLLAFAFNPSYALALPILVVLGLMSLMFVISVEATIQTLLDDRFRGRVMAFVTLTWTINPLGAAMLSAVANFIGAPKALGIGAVIVMLGAVGVALFSRVVRDLGPLSPTMERRGGERESGGP